MFKNKNKNESMFAKKIKTSINNQKQYKIFESKQFLGIILIVIFAFLFVVSIVQVRGFSTINSYTIGMLFGYYSYFIYVGFITLGLCYLFQIDLKIEKFIAVKFNRKFHFSWLPYLFFAMGIALIVESIIKIIETKTAFPGTNVFKHFFNDWWNDFTNKKGTIPNSTSLLPDVMNAGIIVSLFMSLLVSWSGYVVSIIIGLLFVAHFVYYIVYGSIIKQIRTKIFGNPNKKDTVMKKEFEEYKTKIMDLSFEDTSGIIEKPNLEIISDVEAKTNSINISNSENIFPVTNPFEEEKIKDEDEFLIEKTNQINLEKNITTEFKLDELDKTNKIIPDIETFDFELDIFKTNTNTVDIDENGLATLDNKNDVKTQGD